MSLTRRTLLIAAAGSASAIALTACGGGGGGSGGGGDQAPVGGPPIAIGLPNLVELARSNSDLRVLVQAIEAADLGPTLSGPGPFTLFAPTNAAFQALLTELGLTQDALLANTGLLTQVLRYHVVSGRVLRADVPLNTPITTLQGGTFSVNNALVITDSSARTAAIVSTDVLASNGVIHTIDRVLVPAS